MGCRSPTRPMRDESIVWDAAETLCSSCVPASA